MTHQTQNTAKRALRRQAATIAKNRKVITVKPHTYQPSKAELNAGVSLQATPEKLARAVLQDVTIKIDNPRKRRALSNKEN